MKTGAGRSPPPQEGKRVKDVKIVDISLRESAELFSSGLSFKQKIEMAKLLEKLRIDVIETGAVTDAPTDAVLVRTLSTMLESCVICVPVSLERSDVDRASAALSKARHPRLNLIVPTSPVQMEYVYRLKADSVLEQIKQTVEYCAALCPSVEFTAEDATRSELDFLSTVVDTAIKSGAQTITLCDSTGEKTPDEIASFLDALIQKTPALSGVTLSLHLKDTLGLASASALAAISRGVGQFKVTFSGGAGHLSLEQFLNILKVRGEALGIASGTNVTALFRTCRQLDAITGASRAGRAAAVSSYDGGVASPKNVLGPDSDIGAVAKRIAQLGYDVSDEDLNEIFRLFREIAGRKKVDDRDVEALVAEAAGRARPVYQLDNYVINSGNAITATAFVRLLRDGKPLQAISIGDGPIDAAFLAIEQVLDHHYDLEEFQIQAVTEGREAMGDARVKLRYNGKLISGRGLSTDIVGASIRAYLNAVNKIVSEEQNV